MRCSANGEPDAIVFARALQSPFLAGDGGKIRKIGTGAKGPPGPGDVRIFATQTLA